MVETEIIDHYPKYLFAVADGGEDFLFKNVGLHNGTVVATACEPTFVVFFDIFAKLAVCLVFLVGENLRECFVGGNAVEFKFPIHNFFVEVGPLRKIAYRTEVDAQLPKLLLIILGGFFGNEAGVFEVFLDGKQNLVWVNRLDKVVSHIVAHSIVHKLLTVVFGNHYAGNVGFDFLNFAESFQTAESRHIFVKKNNIIKIALNQFERVVAVVSGFNFEQRVDTSGKNFGVFGAQNIVFDTLHRHNYCHRRHIKVGNAEIFFLHSLL